ncbi:cysteine desulfurase family protein (plasmid) [Cyanobacterium sp. IPPAS B-1200]|uniref:cysteine desulfurase family protein n=1 Tax=Cyanobacterium sp. IPPAS B-1200 TaxID=1562720 RepID=UPI0008527FD1|nr:cysteine desulfurase family protein [Cyanobacterium sp. IPPAS B-1200]OEJ78186.1 aminotransferase [Cyanobacterium sp. IPPAS B-1200]
MSNPIYLDYHSTTPVDRRLIDVIYDSMIDNFGNPSSIDHLWGDRSSTAIKKAKQQIADLIQCHPQEIIFTSGATESINTVIQGLTPPHHFIISPLEHKAIIDTCEAMVKRGFAQITWLKVDNKGRIDLEYLEKVCSQGASLLCVMAANNEIGNIYPIQEIGKIAQKYHIPFLCDGSQAVGKIPLNFEDWGITFLTISGHKLYAPKGIGALIIKKGFTLQPLIYGGGHQNGMRSGTLNVSGIVGLGQACYLRQSEMTEDEREIALKRNQLQSLLQAQIPSLIVNGDTDNRLAGNLHISIPDVPNSAMIARVRDKLAISTGSACTSETFAPSHVLRAINLEDELIESALRIGIGKFTTHEEIEKSAEILINTINQICLVN